MSKKATQGCSDCSSHHSAGLSPLGAVGTKTDYLVALAGNPNVGKSTVFNALTGLRQHTGNWPGKTVARAEGAFGYRGIKFKLVDLPGTYSLLSTSVDEEIARDFVLFGRPDVTVVVVDATRLERNLNLVLQIREITDRVVVCLNLMDEAKRHGLEIDHRSLGRELAVAVIPVSARSKHGLPELLSAIHDTATGELRARPTSVVKLPQEIHTLVNDLQGDIERLYPGLPNSRWVALRLLEGDSSIAKAIVSGDWHKPDPSFHHNENTP